MSPEAARRALVEHLTRRGRLPDPAVRQAFLAVPREVFLPEVSLGRAYADEAVAIARGIDGETISSASQPSMIALMLHQLDVRPGQRVLEIGTGSGYNAALLSHLVGAGGAVTSIDIDERLTAAAASHLHIAGAGAVQVRTGDGWAGVPDPAPYDRVVVTVGVGDLSPAWAEQLHPAGILVIPLWLRPTIELSVAFRKRSGALVGTRAWPCGFVRLQGPRAGAETMTRLDDDRTVLMDAPTRADIETIRALLDTPPRVTAAPVGAPGWFARLALEQPGALVLLGTRPKNLSGLLLTSTSEPGLAVVDRGGVVGYGDPGAAELVVAHLRAGHAVDPRRLRITARPRGPAGSGPARWVITRPEHRLELND